MEKQGIRLLEGTKTGLERIEGRFQDREHMIYTEKRLHLYLPNQAEVIGKK